MELAIRRSGQAEPRLVACDIDGTILDSRGAVSSETLAAVRAVVDSGVQVMLATGRSPWDTAPVACALGLAGPQLSMNGGALVWPDGRVVWARRLDPELACDAIAFARRGGLSPLLGFPGGHACEARPGLDPDVPAFAVGPRLRIAERLETMVRRRPVRIYLPTPQDRHARVLAEARDWFGRRASVVYGDRDGLEILPPGTHKGSGLQTVAESLGLEPHEVAAMGDGPNDREMLAYAGHSAALQSRDHAHDHGPAMAGHAIVVPSSDEGGAVEALAAFFPSLDLPSVTRTAA